MDKKEQIKFILKEYEIDRQDGMTQLKQEDAVEIYAERIVKLFAIPDVIEPKRKLKCECKDEWMEDVVYVQCSKCGEKY